MTQFACVFPGQGSQKTGMLASLNERFPQVQDTFNQASEVLGLDCWEITQTDNNDLLNHTHITQPMLLTASVSMWRIWQHLQAPQPSVLAGHSLGEYSALVCAGVLEFPAALKLVHQRGKYMQQAVPAGQGKMAAIIGLDDASIIAACQQSAQGEVVSAANFNALGQTVIAGDANAVDRAMEACKLAGAKRTLPLTVSVPSHCALMQSAAEKLSSELDQVAFQEPALAIIQNVNGAISTSSAQIKENLIKQLYEPVLWVKTVNALHQQGIRNAIECGPGKVLCGLIKRTQREIECESIEDVDTLLQIKAKLAAATIE